MTISHDTGYTFSIRLPIPFGDAERRVRAALQKEGFGILTEVDIQAAFREKLERSFRPYKILGACNPSLAYEALSSELEIGALLPCNVILYEEGGEVVVSVMDPEAVLSLVSRPEVEKIAGEVRGRLERALEELARSREANE
jgi:uncharacterized protein (DUF302 family)